MSQKNVVLMEFEGNPNVGLYMFVNDRVCILGKEVSAERKKEIESVLDVPVVSASVLGTDLIGVFVCGNNDLLIVPEMYDYEMEIFEKICKDYEMKLIKLSDIQNTFGNNMCVGDKEVVVNPNFSKKFLEKVSKETGYDIMILDNKDFDVVGAICTFVNGKYFVSQEIEEHQVGPIIKKVSGVGTVNSGSNFVASGIVGNSKGVIIGSLSSTVEIQNVVESLDYI